MKVVLPYTLHAMNQVTAAQMKAQYDAIAAVVNGNLGRDNIAPGGAISKALKAAPRAWFPLEGQLIRPTLGDDSPGDPSVNDKGPSYVKWIVPNLAPTERKLTMKIGAWSAWVGGTDRQYPDVGLVAGNVRLRRFGDVLDTWVVPYGGDYSSTMRVINPESVVSPGDFLQVSMCNAAFDFGATRIRAFGAAIWLRMEHLP